MSGRVDGVQRVLTCDLRVVAVEWDYAVAHRQDIELNWERARRDNPGYFNGAIYLMVVPEVEGDRFAASFLKTDFKSYLFWRHSGFPEAGVFDGFGSAIIRSKEGQVILGVQGPGHVNASLAYTPGGFIDGRDVSARGHVEIDASVAREVLEETGLDVGARARLPGYILTFHGAQVSIGVEYRLALSAQEICERIGRFIASEADPELTEVAVVTCMADVRSLKVAPFVVPLLGAIFSADLKKS